MNDGNWRDWLAAFLNYLKEPKSRREIKDYSLALAVAAASMLALMFIGGQITEIYK
ncbi:MAG: hypothetical protein LBO03_03570 [Acidaminococcales bacterium]|jgi:hypothetical protein|nr:hypothetical protein [Acidaminococcales bacterium]